MLAQDSQYSVSPQDTGSVYVEVVNYGNTAPDSIYLESTIKASVATTIADNV